MRILVKSRETLRELSEADGVVAIVSVSDDPDDFPDVPENCDCRHALRLHFHDAETGLDVFSNSEVRPFAASQAREVAAFVIGLPENTDTLVFQCELGLSRSAGMAAAVARWMGKDDLQFFKDRLPNRLVYRMVLEQIDPECERAGGGSVCSECGKTYADHPGHPAFPWLTALCGGRNVKL